MSSNTENSQQRVLFTGNGTVVINDLMEHDSHEYRMEKCMPSEPDFSRILKKFRPHTLVVCLSNESIPMLRMIAELKDIPAYAQLPLIVIGNEDDCAVFKKNVFQTQMKIFTRPLDKELFSATLEDFLVDGMLDERRQQDKLDDELRQQEKIAKAHEARAEAPKKPTVPAQISSPALRGDAKTILVVDDDAIMLTIIKLYLKDLYDVVVVPSGKLALKYLAKKSADLVLLDYMMPEDDGPSVLREIRTNSPHPHIPVIFLTGVADKDLVMKGLELRPNGYLLKPASKESLLEKVTEVLLGL